MKTVTVSAPGKLMLLGDHAVVWGYSCLVTAVDYRVFAEVSASKQDVFELPNGCKSNIVKKALSKFRKRYKTDSSVYIKTWADYDHSYGLGSSSAVTVAFVKSLSELFSVSMTHKELFDFCYQIILDVQGVGSGFDIAAAVYGGTLYFETGGKVIIPLQMNDLPLVVGYSGVKGSTPKLVKMVGKKRDKYPETTNALFDQSVHYVNSGKKALEKNNFTLFGRTMSMHHVMLQKLGVSTPKLDKLVESAQRAGAYGAKLSGAGGGDCMIALSPTKKRKAVESAIEQAGGTIIDVTTSAEGVRTES